MKRVKLFILNFTDIHIPQIVCVYICKRMIKRKINRKEVKKQTQETEE